MDQQSLQYQMYQQQVFYQQQFMQMMMTNPQQQAILMNMDPMPRKQYIQNQMMIYMSRLAAMPQQNMIRMQQQFKSIQNKTINTNTFECVPSNGQLYKQLRNEWIIGSKCIVLSGSLEPQWIYTNIIKIENKNGEEILTTNGDSWESVWERNSNNIQPIYVCDEKENKMNNKRTNLLSEEIINKSLYVSHNLLTNKENETRIKWTIGWILIIFDYENNKWVKG
eukprot:377270_1